MTSGPDPAPAESLLYREEVYAIVGAAMDVHSELGVGFLESVYHEALELELAARHIPFVSRAALSVQYRNTRLTKAFHADVLCYNKIIVELKAMDRLGSLEGAQLLSYLKAPGSASVY